MSDLSPVGRQLRAEYRKKRRAVDMNHWSRRAVAVALVGVAFGLAYLPPTQQAEDATQQKTAIAGKAVSVADPILQLCAGGDDTAKRLADAGLCGKAADVKTEAAAQAQPAPQVDPTQVYTAAKAAVVDYCAGHNQCRGADGTSPNIDSIVNQVVARIPVPQNGANGKDAPAVTSAQIFEQVSVYCAQSTNPCQGNAGKDGKDGKDGSPPPCMSEATQCRGADGQPPAGWTTTYPDGSVETCTRSGSFDPRTPTYTCTVAPAPSSSASETSSRSTS